MALHVLTMLFSAPAVVRRNTDLSGGGRTPREIRVGLQRPPRWPMTAPFRSLILKCERRVTVQIRPTEARKCFSAKSPRRSRTRPALAGR